MEFPDMLHLDVCDRSKHCHNDQCQSNAGINSPECVLQTTELIYFVRNSY